MACLSLHDILTIYLNTFLVMKIMYIDIIYLLHIQGYE